MKLHILLATLALGLSALGQSSPPPTITLEIPTEAAGHSFTFMDDSDGQLFHVGVPMFDALTMKFIVTGTPTYSPQVMPWLFDETLGTWKMYPTMSLTASATLQATVFEGGTIGYAVGEGLAGHTFALVAPSQNWAFPVTTLPVLGSWLLDSDGAQQWESFGFFNAFSATEIATLSSENTVLVDLTAQMQSAANATDLRDPAAWEPRSVALPTRAVTFSLGEVAAGYEILPGATFTLHTSSGNMQGMIPYSVMVNGHRELWLGGQVGILEEYWWTRDGSEESTEHFFMGIGHTAVASAGAGLSVPVSDVGIVTFVIGENHFNESFGLLQNGVLTMLESDNTGPHMLVTWDLNGNEVQYYFDNRSVWVDRAQSWELVSVDGNSQVIQSFGQTTDLRDGFSPYNPVPPVGQVSVSIPHARRTSLMNGQIQLLGNDGTTWAVTSVFDEAAGDAYYTYWSGVFIGTPMEHWSYHKYIPATAPSSTTNGYDIAMVDAEAGYTTAYGAGGADLNFTMEIPLTTLNFNLPSSRWNQELYVVTAAGGMFPVNKGTIQGLWTLNGSGAGFSSYGYFDASAEVHIGADWWLYAPYGDNGAPAFSDVNGLDMSGNPSLMNWNPPWVDSDSDTLPDWYEYIIGTNDNAWDSDGDGIGDYDEIVTGTNPNQAAPILTVTSPIGAVWLN